MNDSHDLNLPTELDEIGTNLRESRYEASSVELDELKRRAMARGARSSRVRQGRGSRAVTSFLLMGVLLSGASASVIAGTPSSPSKEPSAAISQYEQIVLGERILPGNARLLAPTGCVGRAFNARVRGQNVASVTFFLDGKKIKKFTKPNKKGLFQVRVNPLRLRIGVHRIVAKIIFKSATKKKPQTLRVSFQRCARQLVAPKFTG